MGKKKRKNIKKVEEKEDFGTCELYCKDCDYEFEMDWEDIFDIQECTHGYVGFHLNDVFIGCPKCGKIITSNSSDENFVSDTKKLKRSKPIEDDELPF
ncbi:hypothetical protein ACERII_14355 [Evansella sp. AB-rgal1]|uniref:hypothetical protein n=1 Tax=Evansella sp. AB-rgal1 TaxID=3242696 RepID=UPI00359D118C